MNKQTLFISYFKGVARMKNILAISLVSVILLSGCLPPRNKQAYLAQYGSFISEVRDNRSNKNLRLDKQDQKFRQFSHTYYKRFESQLSISEKILLKKYELQYYLIRIEYEAAIIKNDLYNSLSITKERIENYIENDMTNDFESIKKEVDSITNSVANALNQALKRNK